MHPFPYRFEKPEARGQNFNLFLLPLNLNRSTELGMFYIPCYKLAAFGLCEISAFWRLAYNGECNRSSGLESNNLSN